MWDFISHRHWSTYVAIIVWGASGFMGTPTIASGIYHLLVIPPLLALIIWLAHHEGRSHGKTSKPST